MRILLILFAGVFQERPPLNYPAHYESLAIHNSTVAVSTLRPNGPPLNDPAHYESLAIHNSTVAVSTLRPNGPPLNDPAHYESLAIHNSAVACQQVSLRKVGIGTLRSLPLVTPRTCTDCITVCDFRGKSPSGPSGTAAEG